MIDKLKTFVSKRKQEFDTEEPSKDLWKKIDARMEVKNSSWISSKWLSKLKYFGLSASVLVIAVYIISQNLNDSSSNELAQNRKDSALNNSEEWVKANQNKAAVNEAGNKIPNSSNEKDKSGNANTSGQTQKSVGLVQKNAEKDSANIRSGETMNSELTETDPSISKGTEQSNSNSVVEKKENNTVKNNKRTKVYIPEAPEKINTYSGTLYEGSSICSVVSAYRFPGKVYMYRNWARRKVKSEGAVETISCSLLEKTSNIKAVWLKGKTNKKLTLSLKNGFEDIKLVKSDGREIKAEAISHYYPGRGVIKDYKGRDLDMIFTSEVGLIVFFKDVEEGDKIVIGGVIEAVIKKMP